MKKILFIAAMALGTGAMAQVSSGNIFLTGNAGITTKGGKVETTGGPVTITTEKPKEFGGSLGIGAGYFLTDNIAAGVNIGLSANKTTFNDTTSSKSSEFNIGIFGRYYMPVSSNFYFHGGLYVGMFTGKSSATSGSTTTDGPKVSGMNIGIRPGFTFFPNEKFGLDMSIGNIGMQTRKSTTEAGPLTTTDKTNDLDIGVDLRTVTFGIQYFLAR
jgi:hypothetical protein